MARVKLWYVHVTQAIITITINHYHEPITITINHHNQPSQSTITINHHNQPSQSCYDQIQSRWMANTVIVMVFKCPSKHSIKYSSIQMKVFKSGARVAQSSYVVEHILQVVTVGLFIPSRNC